MSGNFANILAGISGSGAGNALGRFAPLGTTMPASASAGLDVAFEDPGWCSADDGLTSPISVTSTDVNGFGSSGPLRVIKSQQKRTWSVVFLEHNPITMAIYNELPLDAIVPDGSGAYDYTEGPIRNQQYAAVWDFVDGSNLWRAACPIVQVTDKQQFQVKAGGAVMLGVTFTAYPGSDGVSVHYMGLIPSLAA